MATQLKASQVRVKYQDGREETASLKPLDLIRAERHYGEAMRGHLAEVTLYSAWLALGSPGAPAASFDDWLASLEDFAEGAGEIETDPTTAGPLTDAQQS